jgi:sarcosine oxidase
MPTQYDVIVVGVGAMGAATCWQLARRGVRVLGIEQFGLVHAMGSSHGHTRMIRMAYYEHADYVPLLRRAYELWDDLEAQSGEKVLYRTGGIYMGPPNGEVVAGTTAAAKLHGLPHEILSQADLARRFPQFSLPENFTGIWEPQAGFVLCEKAIGLFTRLALEAGAVLHGHETVRQIDLQSSHVTIATDQGAYEAEKVIICGGAWSGKLLAELNLHLVVTRQALGWIWPQMPEKYKLGTFPVWGIEQSDGSLAYGFPMLSDLPGLKMARHGRGAVADADTVSRTPTLQDQTEVLGIAERYLPRTVGPMLAGKICLYTNSADGHFIIDRHPGSDRAIIACGFSGHGFKFATVVGEALADLATTGKTPLPIDFLNLARFGTR